MGRSQGQLVMLGFDLKLGAKYRQKESLAIHPERQNVYICLRHSDGLGFTSELD